MRRSADLSWPAIRLALAAPVAAGLALAAAAAVAPAPAAQAATTQTFFSTGSEQAYTVPAGVTAVTVTAVGAPGGTGGVAGTGGAGAVVTATVTLPAGTTTLYVEVGGPGGAEGCSGSQSHAFNGGGAGGCFGGDGGGASDVRTTSITMVPDSQLTPATDSRLVVAGGGGGGAQVNCTSGEPGGTAGDTSVTGPGNGGGGSDSAFCSGEAGGNGGFGGTAGGTGGAGSAFLPCPGGSGSLGQGGDALFACEGSIVTGGGGGGGYYGGGAGGPGFGQSGGGGAGSSFWVSGATNTSMSENTTSLAPEVTIAPVIPDDDLAISQRSNITVDATGPSGATVSYALPTVTDPDDASPPAAVCTPASGTVFAIGATTVHCSATGADDTPATVTTSFTITVRGAAAQLAALHRAVRGVGVGTNLARTVATAQQELAAGHPRLACLTLTTFILEVRVQTPRFIPAGQAAQLIADAQRIQAVLGGC